jgi:uncharacterized lipoprotein NlpE involved in copper resistance
MKIKRKSIITLLALLTLFSLIGCSEKSLKKAEFTNTTPAQIKMNNTVYFMKDVILSADDIDNQIGEITKVNEIVSYLDADNPYKYPNKIFKVKEKDMEQVIGIQVNNIIYEAMVEKTPNK